MGKTILVTGVNGFVGEHLTNELVAAGHNVIGAGIQDEAAPAIAEKMKSYHKSDLTDPKQVDALPWTEIDAVIHLAGLSAVGPSFDDPQLYMNINTGVLTGLFEGALRAGSTRPRIVSVSTGAVYAPSDEVLTEESEIAVTSPYAMSKLASELVIKYYRGRGFEDSVNVRPFNHIGPGQGPGFLVPDIALQIKDTEKGGTIKVGNIKTSRDYTDVRDVVRAYRMLVEAENLKHETYNICSGKPQTGEFMLEQLKAAMNRPDVTISIDEDRIRPNDVMYVCGSFDRLREDTGWEPQVPLDTTLHDFADDVLSR